MGKDILLFIALLVLSTSGAYPMYKQCDSRWGSERLGTHPTNTICSAGCLLSSVSMALNGTGGITYNPSTLNTWLNANKGYVQQDLFVWAAINPLGVKFVGFTTTASI